jgi:RimJ/RimL family protein N-acetyltransferase
MSIELSSGDIILRKFRESDSARMVELANNENISKNLRDGFPYPYTLKHAKEFIEKCLSLHPPGIFAIEYKGEYSFNNLDVVRIHAGVYEHNPASQRVLEKCGFTREGTFKKAVFKQEKFWDEVRYARIRL